MGRKRASVKAAQPPKSVGVAEDSEEQNMMDSESDSGGEEESDQAAGATMNGKEKLDIRRTETLNPKPKIQVSNAMLQVCGRLLKKTPSSQIRASKRPAQSDLDTPSPRRRKGKHSSSDAGTQGKHSSSDAGTQGKMSWNDADVVVLLEGYRALREEQHEEKKTFYTILSLRIGDVLEVKPTKHQVRNKINNLKKKYKEASMGTSPPMPPQIHDLCKKAFADEGKKKVDVKVIEPQKKVSRLDVKRDYCSSARRLVNEAFDLVEESKRHSDLPTELICSSLERIKLLKNKILLERQQLDAYARVMRAALRSSKSGGEAEVGGEEK